tara:strand:- start:304 stop:579 length:276 start_codon:yes stop_codon:yes gene_type:complete
MVLTNKQKFNIKHGLPKNQSHSIKSISKLSGYTESSLRTVLSKGRGAYFSSPESVRPHIKSPTEWGMARVYASINPTTKSHKIDKPNLKKK